jgi:hypothetical protein
MSYTWIEDLEEDIANTILTRSLNGYDAWEQVKVMAEANLRALNSSGPTIVISGFPESAVPQEMADFLYEYVKHYQWIKFEVKDEEL